MHHCVYGRGRASTGWTEIKLKNLRNDHEQLLSRVGTILKVGRMKTEDATKIMVRVRQVYPRK
jgi:hypothetical protein